MCAPPILCPPAASQRSLRMCSCGAYWGLLCCAEKGGTRGLLPTWRETVFAPFIPIRRTGQMVCHAGTARLPRRRGTSAMPAWHVCRAGVANDKACSANGKVLCKNAYKPSSFGYIPLKNKGVACCEPRLPPSPPFLSIIFTSKRLKMRKCEEWNKLADSACHGGSR